MCSPKHIQDAYMKAGVELPCGDRKSLSARGCSMTLRKDLGHCNRVHGYLVPILPTAAVDRHLLLAASLFEAYSVGSGLA